MARAPLSRERLETFLHAGLAAAHGGRAVRAAIDRRGERLALAGTAVDPGQRFVVLAAGKAAAAMAAAFDQDCGERIAHGLVVTKDGHGAGAPPTLELRETAHPIPDARCEAAGREALALAAGGAADECLVVLLSGGASALLTTPAPGLSLDDLAATTELLLRSGVAIDAANAVRKHLSAIAGGRLAEAWRGGPVFVLAVSDVPGDRLDVIGSGPCTADPTTFADAVRVASEAGFLSRLPGAVRAHLEAGVRAERAETPKSLPFVRARVIASNELALAAIEAAARAEGLRVARDAIALSGEARDAARASLARGRAAAGDEPLLWLAGGETTVRFDPDAPAGRGGRNQELALASALELAGDPKVRLLAAGSDGTDGPTDAAGAHADGGTVARAAARGVDAAAALACHDAHTFFSAEGGLLRTGPTATNVMDLLLVSFA